MSVHSSVPKIRVLVVEDSPTVRDFLTHILNLVPDFEVVGVAHDGEQAVEMVRQCQPDIVTMDIHMPRMDGFEATRQIMATQATPIVIVSGSDRVGERATAVEALGAGALAVEARPVGTGHPNFARSTAKLVETVRLMAGVKVVRRTINGISGSQSTPPMPLIGDRTFRRPAIVAIGASTGGPQAVAAVLKMLHNSPPFPVVLVQHIADGFTLGLAAWLSQATGQTVRVAVDEEPLQPGQVYVAPNNLHLGINRHHRIALANEPPEEGQRPAVDYLFRSVAAVYGGRAVGVLLTGMGADGATGLGMIRELGGLTLAQDEASSVVHGMPGQAIRRGAAIQVLPPRAIGKLLNQLVDQALVLCPSKFSLSKPVLLKPPVWSRFCVVRIGQPGRRGMVARLWRRSPSSGLIWSSAIFPCP